MRAKTERNAEILAAAREGRELYREIALRYGVSIDRISQICIAAGFRRERRNTDITEREQDAWKEDYRRGFTVAEIVRRSGRSKDAVLRTLLGAGLHKPGPPRGERPSADRKFVAHYYPTKTAAQIAAMRPGLTRNAVIGLAYRMGLSKRNGGARALDR